jgi:hypothetical protein
MSYPQIATTNPYAFALWPDHSEEELAVWTQAAGYVPRGITSDNISQDAWGDKAQHSSL